LLLTDKTYVEDLFAIRTERALKSLEILKDHLKDSIDILCIDGFDCGGQNCELFAPELFEELFVPFLREQNDWVHRNTTWKTWYHSCGSIPRIIPLLIESHMDILNPVQTSAAGMDPKNLKDRFGGKIVFWGGGIDTQKTLPFGSVDEVRREVAERIRIFAPEGGFVFNPVHNVQAGTPPENLAAAFETAREIGRYPIATEAVPR
jgi:uroporphyrinogen-III decarboxylase